MTTAATLTQLAWQWGSPLGTRPPVSDSLLLPPGKARMSVGPGPLRTGLPTHQGPSRTGHLLPLERVCGAWQVMSSEAVPDRGAVLPAGPLSTGQALHPPSQCSSDGSATSSQHPAPQPGQQTLPNLISSPSIHTGADTTHLPPNPSTSIHPSPWLLKAHGCAHFLINRGFCEQTPTQKSCVYKRERNENGGQ